LNREIAENGFVIDIENGVHGTGNIRDLEYSWVTGRYQTSGNLNIFCFNSIIFALRGYQVVGVRRGRGKKGCMQGS
jgi:hypothetical protein